MDSGNSFIKVDPFAINRTIIKSSFLKVDPFVINRSIKVISKKYRCSQSDIVLKFQKIIEHRNKEFLLNVQVLLEQALSRF